MHISTLYPHWQNIWQHKPSLETPLFDTLVTHYQETQRHYHTLEHLSECFVLFEEVKDALHRPDLVALALFYHDVIYDPKSKTNEQDSADFAKQALQGKCSDDDLDVIVCFILATKQHINTAQDPKHAHDLAYLLDIDLAILAADDDRFKAYEQQIRQEYHHVPQCLYRLKRRQILQAFYDKQRLFYSDYFYQKLERRAKANLGRLLACWHKNPIYSIIGHPDTS